MVMKKIAYGLGLAIALVSCLDVEDRPVLSMLTEANSLTLTTADTLVITRAVTNSGRNDVWLNAAADAYEMTASGGTRVCDASAMLALTAPENVRIPAGQGIVVLEAMKMENEIKAAHAGTIARVHVAPGQAVTKNALLIEFEG